MRKKINRFFNDKDKEQKFKDRIKRSLKRDEFILVYQPQFDLKTNKIKGAEVLIRWFEKERNFILPENFIPFAEETEVIIDIDKWVIDQAFESLSSHFLMNEEEFTISINISGKTITCEHIYDYINRKINETSINPRKIILEITETSLIKERKKAIEIIERLKKLGIKIALDDFGTGYSSINYLQEISVDYIKLDKGVIHNTLSSDRNLLITQKIIELAHLLEIQVIAEGVETENQISALQKMNCDFAQGYFFFKPITLHELVGLSKNEQKNTSS